MNREDIIRMAREADFAEGLSDTLRGVALVWDAETKHLERFAALVAAAERESMIADGWRQCAQGQKTTQFCGMVEQEREACAITGGAAADAGRDVAAAIRARGQA